jgi:hypothetical protein
MKKLTVLVTVLMLTATTVPGHCFLDYFFSGSSSRDAIDNSVLGDLRAWWSGNPAYQYNPWHSPGPVTGTPGAPQGAEMSAGPPQMGGQQPMQPPVSQYYPPGQYPQQAPGGYDQGQGYGQQYQGAPQQYQGAPQQYQAAQQPQAAAPSYQYEYQAPAQQYQGPAVQQSQPQGYPQAPPQYQAAAPQGYPPQQYPAAPQGYPQGSPQQPGPQNYQYQYPMQQ